MGESSHRPLRLIFAAAAAFLVLTPLAVPHPGLPPTLKSDEPAYYAAALSLAHDGDLRCEKKDLRRLYDEYPHLPIDNLILSSNDGWRTVGFGKPFLYPLFVAPAARLFAARGVVAMNMLLFLAMLCMGYRTLRRFNDAGLAATYATGFLFLGPPFVYAFWLQPELFNMFGVMACLYLGLVPPAGASKTEEIGGERMGLGGTLRAFLWTGAARPAWSAAALALAVYHKPMYALVGLPVLWAYSSRRRWRALAGWLAAAVVATAILAGLSWALSGSPSAYLGSARAGVKIEDPERFEAALEPLVRLSDRAMEVDQQPLASFDWLIRVPELFPRLLKENLGYFLWGRHTGLLLYMPFGALAILLFLINDRRSGERWVILASLTGVALIFLIWIHYNWHGGSGFIGNRYFAGVYPAFLFLVTRIRPATSLLLGAAAGGLFLGPLALTPYGAPVPDPTLQAHTRGAAFQLFPQELTIRHAIPGYETMTAAGASFRARQDLVEAPDVGSGTLQVRGATTTEIWITASDPLDSLIFAIGSPAADNPVRLRLGRLDQTVSPPPGESELVELTPRRETRVWHQYGKRTHAYRLHVSTRTGRNPRRPSGEVVLPQFYVGAELTFLGSRRQLTRKPYYRLDWGELELPESIAAGESFAARLTLQNQGPEAWPADGVLPVRLSHRWLDSAGRIVGEGISSLPRRVTPSSWSQATLELSAPRQEGAYILEIDAVREGLVRFSELGAPTLRRDVDVVFSR